MSPPKKKGRRANPSAAHNTPLAVQRVELPAGVAQGLQQGDLTIVRAEQSSFSGPLPHPDLLKGYEECTLGAAERIIKMAEEQAAHRQRIEASVVTGDIWRANWGMFLSFTICLASIAGGVYVVSAGQPYAGAGIAAAPTGVVGAIYAWGQFQRRAERAAKAAQMTQPNRR